MLKINSVGRECARREEEDGFVQGPVAFYLEVEDSAGNSYQILTNETTYNAVDGLINLIKENQSHLKEA